MSFQRADEQTVDTPLFGDKIQNVAPIQDTQFSLNKNEKMYDAENEN